MVSSHLKREYAISLYDKEKKCEFSGSLFKTTSTMPVAARK